jgi:hypothetical protein
MQIWQKHGLQTYLQIITAVWNVTPFILVHRLLEEHTASIFRVEEYAKQSNGMATGKTEHKETNRRMGSSASEWPLLNPLNLNNREDYGSLDGKVKEK